jgi:hypothetical protein
MICNRRALDEHDRQAEHLKIELHDMEKCRERDHQDHIHILENAKVLDKHQRFVIFASILNRE